jgi:RNA polymerase sigma-70 factor (ECF subfamily)
MDRQAFERFVIAQQESLRRFLLGLCGNRETADDLAQEAFIKAYQHLSSFRGNAKMTTWLFSIARNCFYDYAKKTRKFAQQSLDDNISGLPCEPYNYNEKDEELYLALDTLNGVEREAVLLFYMEDKSLKEIAAITGVPVNTVKSHLRRAKQQLKQFIIYNS